MLELDMIKFCVSIVINKSLDVVLKALNNPDNFPYWQTDLVKFEVIKGTANEVGAIAHLHYKQNGKEYILEDKLIICDPGKRYVSRVLGDVITAVVETTLRSFYNKTEMALKWRGKGTVLFVKILLPFIKKKMIKQSKLELNTFKSLVEEMGEDFNEKN